MNAPETGAIRARQLAREHFVIREAMKRIESRIDGEADESEERALLWDIFSLVGSLRDHLTRHFRLEEAGGLLCGAVQHGVAETQRFADGLVAQHRDFEHRLERILDQLDSAVRDARRPSKAATDSYEQALRSLLRDLASHEREEAGLLEQVILRESTES